MEIGYEGPKPSEAHYDMREKVKSTKKDKILRLFQK